MIKGPKNQVALFCYSGICYNITKIGATEGNLLYEDFVCAPLLVIPKEHLKYNFSKLLMSCGRFVHLPYGGLPKNTVFFLKNVNTKKRLERITFHFVNNLNIVVGYVRMIADGEKLYIISYYPSKGVPNEYPKEYILGPIFEREGLSYVLSGENGVIEFWYMGNYLEVQYLADPSNSFCKRENSKEILLNTEIK